MTESLKMLVVSQSVTLSFIIILIKDLLSLSFTHLVVLYLIRSLNRSPP